MAIRELPPEFHKRIRWFVAGATLGSIGVLVALYSRLDVLLWISFAVTMITAIGLTVTNVVYTTRYLNKKSERH